MRQTLAHILDIGIDPDDEPDLRVRKRTAVAAALTFLAVGAFVFVVDLTLGLPVQAALALLQVIIFSTALLVYRRTRRLAPLVVTMSVVGTAILAVSLIPAGGLKWGATNIVWIILVPLAAVLFLGARAAVPALAGVVAVVVVAVLLDPVIGGQPRDSSLARLLFAAISIVVPAAIALGLVVFIDGERVRAKAESEALLLNVLPAPIADRLKRGETVIADHYDDVTVLFADIVDFTPFAARETPARLVELLNEIFSAFDSLVAHYGLEKIKTIGDSYMVVAGAPDPRADHARVIVEVAVQMHARFASTRAATEQGLRLRTGIASGSAVAGVIGQQKFSYDLWGGAVNLASRMETTGVADMIQVSSSTWQLCHDTYEFAPREVEVKGLGAMQAYLLDPSRVPREELPA